jgi:formate hydrogenlyase transcriptional activator
MGITHIAQAVERTSTAEDRLRVLIDTAPTLVWTALPDGSVDFINKRGLDYHGLSLEEALGWGWTAVFHPEDLTSFVDKWRASLATGAAFEAEGRLRRADGEYRWFLSRGVPLRDESGNVLKWHGTTTDIEDRKRAEAALRHSQELLRLVVDTTPALVHTGRPDGYLDFFNQRWLKYLGLPLEDVCGWRWTAVIHPEDVAGIVDKWRASLATGEAFEAETRVRRADGEYRWFLHRKVPLRDKLGQIVKWYGTSVEIEDRKRAEDALRRSQAYLAEAQTLSHTGSFGWNVTSGEIFWSEETFRIFQYDRTAKPTVELLLERVHSEDRALVQQTINRASQDGKNFTHEYRLLMTDGSVKYLRVVAHALSDESPNIEFAGAVMDVTAAKEVEDRIRLIVNTVPGLHWSARPDGWVDFINQRWLDYTGMTLEQALGWGWTPAYHPDELEQVQVEWRAALAEGKPLEMESRLRRFDGEYRWFLERVSPLFDRTGHILGWYGSDIDIHDRKQAEEKIRQQEKELRHVVDLAPQLVAVFGAGQERLYANRILLDYLGLTLEEWRQKFDCSVPSYDTEFLHPDDWERVIGHSDRAVSSGSGFELEMRLRKSDGSYRWFLTRYNPLRDEHGQITRWYVAGTDIDDRKQAEEKLRQENVALREEIDKASMFEEIVGASPALHAVLANVTKVAPTDSTVLITGETGTGKELIARAVHKRSPRSSRSFVSVNCAAIPQNLIASELFGHEKGAFTGALQRRLGRFELAAAGTIFLDEVGDLPAETQVALLRVLQEREFERVGGNHPIQADVRVIVATNRDLQAAIAAGTFRDDLFYRLNVFPIHIPPLRERKDDIPILVEYFIGRYAARAGKKIRNINKKTMDLLLSYPWPGNIRELQNVIERSVVICETENLSVDQRWLSRDSLPAQPASQPLAKRPATQEKQIIEAALAEARGRVSGPAGAAAKLGLPPSTLESKIRSLRINKYNFKTSTR